jgi:glycosyltransferase involved in cell wall biosynthesis
LNARSDVETHLISTPPVRSQKLRSVVQILGQLGSLLVKASSSDVISLHCSRGGLHAKGLVVGWVARLFGKPLMIRVFGGGDFREVYGRLRTSVILHVLKRANLYLAQTKELVRLAKGDGIENVEWYPTSRPMANSPPRVGQGREQCRRFVYVGHVRESKGVGDIIEAIRHQGPDVIVDVYGPLRDGMTEEDFSDVSNVQYRGVLAPEEVVPTLRGYDAMIMASRRHNEGYPGVILEAYSAGIPVIATRTGAIPELVDEGESGIVVEPGDVEALSTSMRRLADDSELYARLLEGASRKAREFSSQYWAGVRFVELCRKIARRKP